jgi:hypothetical protein
VPLLRAADELFEETTRLPEYYPYSSHAKAPSTRDGSAQSNGEGLAEEY